MADAPAVAPGPGEVHEPGDVPDPRETPPPATADGTADATEDAPVSGPRVHVHRGRLDRRVAPMDLSPTEALRLAEEGRAGLARRELPPDEAGGSGDADEA